MLGGVGECLGQKKGCEAELKGRGGGVEVDEIGKTSGYSPMFYKYASGAAVGCCAWEGIDSRSLLRGVG